MGWSSRTLTDPQGVDFSMIFQYQANRQSNANLYKVSHMLVIYGIFTYTFTIDILAKCTGKYIEYSIH